MTPEELDRARADEARKKCVGFDCLIEAARLAREGWTPPPAVPADLLRAREILASLHPGHRDSILSGMWDNHTATKTARIALHDPTFVIPTEVDWEMLKSFRDEWENHYPLTNAIAGGTKAVLNLLRDRAAKNTEVLRMTTIKQIDPAHIIKEAGDA